MPFRLNNRLDILDNQNRWLEARVISLVSRDSISVNFKGFAQQYDEVINTEKEQNRIYEVGAFSSGHGYGKTQEFQQKLRQEQNSGGIRGGTDKKQDDRQPLSQLKHHILPMSETKNRQVDFERIDWSVEEVKFRKSLQEKRFRIVETGTDGNCLFRSIAHQAYGDEDEHKMVRQKCMEYILSEKEYFSSYIIGGVQEIENYVMRKKQNGIWGDDLEIQALSEIYNRPIEIYSYANVPMRTFHEQQECLQEPFRLSYHRQSHYNSIIHMNWNYDKCYIKKKPGEIEDEAIMMSTKRKEEERQLEENSSSLSELNDKVSVLSLEEKDRMQIRNEQNIRLIAQTIQRSREEFEIQGKQDMDDALKLSMVDQYNILQQRSSSSIENKNVQRALHESQLQLTEEQMIKLALEQSIKEHENQQKPQSQRKNQQQQPTQPDINFDDEIMKTILEMSKNEFQGDNQTYSPTIQMILQNGYTLDQAIEAVSFVGENPDYVFSYLFEKYGLKQ